VQSNAVARAAGVSPISANDPMRCAATHFDAAQHNCGAVQHFIRAVRVGEAAAFAFDSGHRRSANVHSRHLAWILLLIECAATMSAHGIKRPEGR
jgi:hypothetical protein